MISGALVNGVDDDDLVQSCDVTIPLLTGTSSTTVATSSTTSTTTKPFYVFEADETIDVTVQGPDNNAEYLFDTFSDKDVSNFYLAVGTYTFENAREDTHPLKFTSVPEDAIEWTKTGSTGTLKILSVFQSLEYKCERHPSMARNNVLAFQSDSTSVTLASSATTTIKSTTAPKTVGVSYSQVAKQAPKSNDNLYIYIGAGVGGAILFVVGVSCFVSKSKSKDSRKYTELVML